MAYDIGTARGVIEMEYNGRGIDQAQEDVENLKQSGEKGQQALKNTGRAAGIAGLAIAGGLALAVNSAANFEQRMSAVEAVSGASAKEMDALSEKALQLGKDTAFSATESASAIEELVKAGLSVEDVLNGAADATVNLAAAGEISMPEAAAIASNAMNQFGLSAKDMVGVADNIAGAANASAIDVSDFGQSLSQVGAVANLAGVDFEDTATAIALLGNAGIKGSDAGTSLKSMFQRLQPVTAKQKDLFKELGLITEDGANKFYDAQGNMKDLGSVAGVLQKSLQGMTKQQKQATLNTLFGSDAIRAAAILSNEGSKGFDKMAASMAKTSAAEVAATRMDNLKGRLEELKGSLETAGISIGSALLPAVNSIVVALTKAVNWFLNLSSATQKWVAGGAVAVAAVLLIVAAIIKMIIVAGRIQAALVLLRGTMIATWLAALGPIALIIAAVAAVVAIIILLWNKSETFKSVVLAVWGAIKAAALAVAAWFAGPFVNFFTSAWEAIKSGVQAVAGFFAAVWGGIKAVVAAVFGAIATVITTYINIWKTVITTGINIIKAIWGALWGTFGGIIKGVFNLIVAIVRLGWTIIKGLFILHLNAIRAVTSAVWNAIKAVISAVWNVIVSVVRANVNAVRAVVTAVWNAIKAVTSAVWNAIKSVISSVWGAIGGTVTSAVNRVRSTVTSAWNAVKSATSSIWNALAGIVGNAVDAMMAIVSGIQGRITGFFSGAAGWLVDSGRAIIQGLIDGIESMIDNITSVINNVTDRVSRFLPGSPVEEGPLKVLNRGYAGKQIVEMLIGGISDMAQPLADAMNDTLAPASPSGYATPGAGALPAPRRRPEGGRSRRARFVDGELRLDPSGRAFISGVAQDDDDSDDDYDDTLDRMGGR